MTTLLESLREEPEAVGRLTRVAGQRSCPDFGDLWWDPEDFGATFDDPAILFATAERKVVLARLRGELRYYAGDADIYAPEYEYEIGTFPAVKDALAFAERYLTSGSRLADLADRREVRKRYPSTSSTYPAPPAMQAEPQLDRHST